MAAQRSGNAGGSGNPWQRFLEDFMRSEDLSDEMMAVIMGYKPVSITRWREGAKPPRDWELYKNRLDGRRMLIKKWREMLRDIRS